jgi:2-isopropylmalate synthase
MTHIQLYDTTLRDGAQGEGVNFSLQDKLLVARRLDELGFDFVEGGYPLSNPKDAEFFQRIAENPLQHSRVCFGKRALPEVYDESMKALIGSCVNLFSA